MRVRERAEHPDGAGRVHAGADLGLGVFRPHGAAPDLGVVEEEQLIVSHVEPGQVKLLAVKLHPLLVSPIRLKQETMMDNPELYYFQLGKNIFPLI